MNAKEVLCSLGHVLQVSIASEKVGISVLPHCHHVNGQHMHNSQNVHKYVSHANDFIIHTYIIRVIFIKYSQWCEKLNASCHSVSHCLGREQGM